MSKHVTLSLIIPFYNEEKSLSDLIVEVNKALEKFSFNCEIILINDGSTDNSEKSLKSSLAKKNKINTKIISFRKNFGQTAAISAGIDQSMGEYIAFMDADLQNDPRDLSRFFSEIQKGYDAVFGWRKKREDFFARNYASIVANFIIRKIFKVPLHDVGCSLKVVKRSVINDIHFYGESHRIMPVIIFWKSTNISEIVVNHRRRLYEKSKYGYSRILKLIIDLITIKFLNSYATKPAYIFGTIGILSSVFGMICIILVAYRKIFLGVYVHRDPLFLIAVFFILLGTQFILMGLIAELQVRTYFESQKKTTYEITKIENY